VTDSWGQKHELNEQMFLDFMHLVPQEHTDYKTMDKFLEDKSSELSTNRDKAEKEREKMGTEKEADNTFKKYNQATRE
jgi:hypothetical protein